MKPKVYLETSVLSYLTARSSRDLIVAANQQITREWWATRKDEYELYVSQIVVEEARTGDAEAAQHRLEVVRGIPQLATILHVEELAEALFLGVPLPPRAKTDALHIASAAVHGMNYLVTWNCAHIANATLRPRIEAICRDAGYEPPIICTPQELLGKDDELS